MAGALRALHCLRDLEALRLAMKVSGAGEERRRLLRRIVDEEPPETSPCMKRPRCDDHAAATMMDGRIRVALRAAGAPDEIHSWWCVTTAVLIRLDTSRRGDAPPYALSVCRRLADIFFVRSVACLARGAADELYCDTIRLDDDGGDAVHIKALRCTLLVTLSIGGVSVTPADPRGYAAHFLVNALVGWCDRCERGDTLVDPPSYPPEGGDGPIHDVVQHPELNDITKEEITDGMRDLWIARRIIRA